MHGPCYSPVDDYELKASYYVVVGGRVRECEREIERGFSIS